MALSGQALGAAIYDALVGSGSAIEDETARSIWEDEIGPTIVAHIQSNAEVDTNVSTTLTVASVTAVTPGVGVSGPGTGTGSGTGTGTIT